MTFSASRARIARTRPPALMVRDRMLKVGLPRMAGAGRESTGAVPDLDEMTQGAARLVPACFALMIAFMGRDRPERARGGGGRSVPGRSGPAGRQAARRLPAGCAFLAGCLFQVGCRFRAWLCCH